MAGSSSYSYKGREYTFVDTPVRLLEEVKCPICLQLVAEPVETSCCGQLFCSHCIEGQKDCPTCRWEFRTKPNNGTARLMKAFRVKCPNSEDDCEWEGDLGDVEKHTETKCSIKKTECPNGCGDWIKLQVLDAHVKNTCTLRKVKCPCGIEVIYSDIHTKHYATCNAFPVKCPAKCSQVVERKYMMQHLTECPEELVTCDHAALGVCNAIVKRKDKENHVSDETAHYYSLMQSYAQLQQIVSAFVLTRSFDCVNVTCLPLSYRPWLQNTPTCYPHPPWVVK